MDNTISVNGTVEEIKYKNPIVDGIKLSFAVTGMSVVFGFILVFLLGTAGLKGQETSEIFYAHLFIGWFFSLYISFLLYRQYSQQISALVALIVTDLIVSVPYFKFLSQFTALSQTEMLQFNIIITIIVCGIGWYLAKETKLKIFLFSRKWVTAFTIIGVIRVFLEFFQLIVNPH